MTNLDAAMDPREPRPFDLGLFRLQRQIDAELFQYQISDFDPPLVTDPHLSKFGDHPSGQHYMAVGYHNAVFLVMHDEQEEQHLSNLLSWFGKLANL